MRAPENQPRAVIDQHQDVLYVGMIRLKGVVLCGWCLKFAFVIVAFHMMQRLSQRSVLGEDLSRCLAPERVHRVECSCNP